MLDVDDADDADDDASYRCSYSSFLYLIWIWIGFQSMFDSNVIDDNNTKKLVFDDTDDNDNDTLLVPPPPPRRSFMQLRPLL
mmetsp:Transcript_61807/g.69180  ORF Transcript_61807/g.69180 Transcript_61807/m.69180 type:complete len:82 (-) Transcript_61807:131-376(-)